MITTEKAQRSQKIQLVSAGVLSILAQGMLILPSIPTSILKLPDWGSLTIGVVFFAIATIWIVSIIRSLNTGWRGNAHFILNQAVIVIGIFFLFESSGSLLHLGGFILTSLITALTIYGIIANTSSPALTPAPANTPKKIENFRLPDLAKTLEEHKEQLALTNQKLSAEKQRNTQLTYLVELSHQLNNELDPPVAAQRTVDALERSIKCTVVSLMMYEADKKEFVVLASSGSMTNIIPSGYSQNADAGLYSRLTRQKKTIIVNDTTLEREFIPINDEKTLSIIIVPLLSHGQIKGSLEVRSDKAYAFNNMDIAGVEGAANELVHAWERSSYNLRLTELIQSGISLTTLFDPQAAVQEIALLARKTFEARFVFVTLLDQQGDFSRTAYAGEAPNLLNSLNENPAEEPLLQAALNAAKPFRVRDLRKYTSQNNLNIDNTNLRSVLAIPIRLHRLSIGTVLVFGKQDGVFFSETDEALADLLGSQAAASVESSWLYQELRNKESITSMLMQLSEEVIVTEEIGRAAERIASAALKATNATETGIVLITSEGDIQADVELDTDGYHQRHQHPMDIIQQAIQTKQSMFVSKEQGLLVCYPLLTRTRPVGALWISIPESRGQNFANIQLMANQAAVTLERVNLLAETREHARELEETYDLTLEALMSALDARDRETEGHSKRVSRLSCMLGEKIGLTSEQLKALERGSLLHDIGKIGISDVILHKPGKLTEDEWKIMRMHPEIGARIVERIPFLMESMPVVLCHHERWDGSGYPRGIKGKDIPIHARIFAVVDVFDALTSNRVYRKKSSPDEALQYLREQSDMLFDREIVDALSQLPYADFIEGKDII